MRLKLNNIGIIREADINIDGLTVIAGENDSGKSTVGKVLYSMIKTLYYANRHIGGANGKLLPRESEECNKIIQKVFNSQISDNGTIEFDEDFLYSEYITATIQDNKCTDFIAPKNYISNSKNKYRAILIETPFIWNLFLTLSTIKDLKSSGEMVNFRVSPIVDDLHFSLSHAIDKTDETVKVDIKSVIHGSFEKDSVNGYSFVKNNEKIELENTAMGIKYFGILQVLSNNNYLFKDQILILDEPEVHLHPKWQLELAKVIVNLVSNGVKVLVNSHSPYMIEALQRYSKKQNIPNNFYLADECKIVEDDQALSKIFAKLSEPFDEFDKMDSEALNG